MRVLERLITYEDYLEGNLPEGLYEIVNGEVVEMAPTGDWHGYFETSIASFLKEKSKKKAWVLVGEVGIVLKKNPLTLRGLDIVYISKERLKELTGRALEVPPELAIEIVSPSNTYTELERKVSELLDFGVDRVLLIDPQLKKAFLHKRGSKLVEVYDFDEEFELLEGLKIKLSEVLEE